MLIFLAGMMTIYGAQRAFAWNPITDIQQNTTFPIGQAASAGTAVNLRNGDLAASALAQLVNYRMFSGWYGGTFVNKTDASMTDTAKIGINLGYFLASFANNPPLILQNLVVGPSFAMSLISTPRVGTPFFDVNYKFGGAAAPAAQ